MRDIITRYKSGIFASGTLAALIFALPFERIPSIDLLNGQVTIRLNQILALIFIFVALPIIWRRRAELLKLPRILIAIFLFVMVLSVSMSLDLGAAVRVLVATALTLATALTISLVGKEERLSTYEGALLLGAWIAVAFGMFQYFGDTFGLSSSITGLTPNYVKEVFGFPRIQSTALEPLFFASFMLIPFSILSVKQLVANKIRPVTLFAITTTIMLTVSRGAIAAGVLVAVSLTGATTFYKRKSWKKIFTYLGIVLGSAIFAYLLTFTSSIVAKNSRDTKFGAERKTKKIVSQTINFDSQDDRVRNRQLAWRAFKSQPLLGIGPGNFDRYAKEQYVGYRQAPRVIVNNEPLELLAETGIVGFATLLTFFMSLLIFTFKYVAPRYLLGSLDLDGGVWAAGLTAYLGATAVQYQTFSTLYIMHIWVVIGLLMAIVLPTNTNKLRKNINGKQEKPARTKN